MHSLGKEHWEAVKWILRYVKGSIDRGLVFDRNKVATLDVIGFVDVDYANDLDKRRSISGYIFTMSVGAIRGKHHFSLLQLFLLQKKLSMLLLQKVSRKLLG